MIKTMRLTWAGLFFIGIHPVWGQSQPDPEPMNNQRLEVLAKRIDPKVEGTLGRWKIVHEGYQAHVITDEKADRMRVIVPISPVKDLDANVLMRMMQANFDSALDARYCIAQEILWAAFIHPLAPLSDDEFVSGVAQAINLAATYGTTYTSGALIFGGGDSQELQNKFYEEILKKWKSI